MKTLIIKNTSPEDLNWLMGAIESRQSGNTDNAKFKGSLIITIAELMEEKETPPPDLKEVEK